ncbi:MAG TPA: hypothetical protein VHJ83_07990 [Micromonosporaceae bacterium]|jgi:hypothetical protein|nr:hypothetical protein [Micromonosporaceae bacterium]
MTAGDPAGAVVDLSSVDGGDDTPQQVSVYLLPAGRAAARKHAENKGLTNAGVALQAIDAMAAQLPALIEARHTGRDVDGSEGSAPSLFPPRRRKRGSGGKSRVLWSINLTPSELEVVDGLVTRTGARSRSELISVAIEAHLLPRPRRRH